MTRLPKIILGIAAVVGCLVAGVGFLAWREKGFHTPQEVPGLTAIHVAAEGDGAAASRRIMLPDGTSILLARGSTWDYKQVDKPVKGYKATLEGEAIIEKTDESMRLFVKTPVGHMMLPKAGRYSVRGTDREQLVVVDSGMATVVEVKEGMGHARSPRTGEAVLVRPGYTRPVFVKMPIA